MKEAADWFVSYYNRNNYGKKWEKRLIKKIIKNTNCKRRIRKRSWKLQINIKWCIMKVMHITKVFPSKYTGGKPATTTKEVCLNGWIYEHAGKTGVWFRIHFRSQKFHRCVDSDYHHRDGNYIAIYRQEVLQDVLYTVWNRLPAVHFEWHFPRTHVGAAWRSSGLVCTCSVQVAYQANPLLGSC